MGLFSFILDMLSDNAQPQSDEWVENDSWFEHSGEEHDVGDGYCLECDDDEENLID